MRKKRKKNRIISLLFLLAAVMAPSAGAENKKAQPAYALVGGTVFQESGFALPNAAVTIGPDPQPGDSAPKSKKMQAISDARGEFVFRVPPGAMHYILKVSAKRHQAQEKSVAVQRDERVDVTFQLQAESNQ